MIIDKHERPHFLAQNPDFPSMKAARAAKS